MPINKWNSALLTKITLNTFFQLGGKSISTILSVASTFLLTHYLYVGHIGFGIYTFALALTSMFGSFADWGTSQVAVKIASQNPNNSGKILGNALILRLCFALVAVLASLLVININPSADGITKIVTTFLAANLIIFSVKTTFQIVFTVKLQMQNWAISEIVTSLLSFISIGLLMIFNKGLVEIVLGIVVANVFATLLTIILSQKIMPIRLELDLTLIKKIVKESLPMGSVMGVLIVYNRLDILLLSHFKGVASVADYGLAYRIFDVLFLLGSYFGNTLLPLISQLAVDDIKKLRDFWSKCISLVSIVGGTLCLGTLIFSPLLIGLLGGSVFTNAITPLRILSFSFLVSFSNVINGYIFLALGKQKVWLKIALIALIFNLFSNLILIPILGTIAAAFNTFLTETLILVLSFATLRKTLGNLNLSLNPLVLYRELIHKYN